MKFKVGDTVKRRNGGLSWHQGYIDRILKTKYYVVWNYGFSTWHDANELKRIKE